MNYLLRLLEDYNISVDANKKQNKTLALKNWNTLRANLRIRNIWLLLYMAVGA